MAEITINVSVPFEGCMECKKIELIRRVFYSFDEPCHIAFECEHYDECENAKKIADMRGEE